MQTIDLPTAGMDMDSKAICRYLRRNNEKLTEVIEQLENRIITLETTITELQNQ